MCYFLYGAVNIGANADDCKKAMNDGEYRFNIGDLASVNACVENCEEYYRITVGHCDCDSPIGKKDASAKELKKLKQLLLHLKDVRNIKYVLISKNWWKERNDKQETVHIEDIDVAHFLANMEDNCLYKIELYKKYY